MQHSAPTAFYLFVAGLRCAKTGNSGIFLQKLEYIHTNPVKAGICVLPEDYKYSSARFDETGFSEWDFITHFRG